MAQKAVTWLRALCVIVSLTDRKPLVAEGLDVDAAAHRLQQLPQTLNSHAAFGCPSATDASMCFQVRVQMHRTVLQDVKRTL